MDLIEPITLRIMCVFAYLNMLFTYVAIWGQPNILDDLSKFFHKKIPFIGYDEIFVVYTFFLFVGYALVIIAVIEFSKRKPIYSPQDSSNKKPFYKKIFAFLFYIGIAYEMLFLYAYSYFLVTSRPF